VLHTFRAGHRIQVQVQSTWFPLVARNPQTFVENPWRAKAEDYRASEHVVHAGSVLAVSLAGKP